MVSLPGRRQPQVEPGSDQRRRRPGVAPTPPASAAAPGATARVPHPAVQPATRPLRRSSPPDLQRLNRPGLPRRRPSRLARMRQLMRGASRPLVFQDGQVTVGELHVLPLVAEDDPQTLGGRAPGGRRAPIAVFGPRTRSSSSWVTSARYSRRSAIRSARTARISPRAGAADSSMPSSVALTMDEAGRLIGWNGPGEGPSRGRTTRPRRRSRGAGFGRGTILRSLICRRPPPAACLRAGPSRSRAPR